MLAAKSLAGVQSTQAKGSTLTLDTKVLQMSKTEVLMVPQNGLMLLQKKIKSKSLNFSKIKIFKVLADLICSVSYKL